MNASRPVFLRQWPARRAIPDNQASELDNTVPLRPEFPAPKGRARTGLHLVAATVAVAVFSAGVVLLHESTKPAPRTASVLVGMS